MNPRVHRTRVSHERWLVSYADFITLLFAFFVVLYAFAKADQKKQAQVSTSIDTAFHALSIIPDLPSRTGPMVRASARIGMPIAPTDIVASEEIVAPARVKVDLEQIRRELEHALSNEIARHSVSITMSRDGLVISLREAGFFNSGSAAPLPGALDTLRQIAASVGSTPYDVRVEGHTDNTPIHNAEFDSNWELSSARATRIARIFLDLHAIPPDRLSAAGYAEFHPAASNSTATGRAENRRVDLVVMPRNHFDFAAPDPPAPAGPWQRVTDDDATPPRVPQPHAGGR